MNKLNSLIRSTCLSACTAAAVLSFTQQAKAQVIFADDFYSGASPLWGNEVGAWSDAGGVYSATLPGAAPNAFSSLPFTLTDYSMDVDVVNVGTGGIWSRSAAAPGTTTGITGVLLAIGGSVPTGLYWHIDLDGNSYGQILAPVGGLFNPGDDVHLRVEVQGDTYAAYVNGSPTPATTINTSAFSSGRLALYDFTPSTHSYDNVSVAPEPSSALLLLFGAGLVSRHRSLRAKGRNA